MPRTNSPSSHSSLRLVAAVTALVVAGTLGPALADPSAPAASASPTVQSGPKAASSAGAAPAARRRPPLSFQLATFNILGSNHTAGPGGYGPGTTRARGTARLIRHKGIDLVGMQEVQSDQLSVLREKLPRFRLWPGGRLGNQGIRLQIAWRRSMFSLVQRGYIVTRFDHHVRPIPWVQLRNRGTGRRLYVVDIHNPPNRQERDRDSATRAEIRLVNRLRDHHRSVLVVGDMNEKREWFCRVVGHTDVRAANGGRVTRRRCRPPEPRMRIDWLMGGRRLSFSDYREDRRPFVRRVSDHAFVQATVHVPG